MGPDLFWVAIFSLGGLAMALITSLVGLPKGTEVIGWIMLYVFWTTTIVILDIHHPFWTLFAASMLGAVWTGGTQTVLRDRYLLHNPWYADEMPGTLARAAISFFGFALAAGALFGVVFGGVAWTLSLL